ncbi:MBL fold metallo-hydrolase [Sphingobacterium sp. DK4209]|uniref:MBL fold metallo-hydrolase n=1 Tax=Sphingobacterium zhuxiongii TaxID=2662364 RepID=A0A5Q0QEK3_9SPHI|nr:MULTISPECIES: MBL fold metallo-hydrolase [unclassified Sphingobacterium]MVZ67105.1 MBL fold metallo-hydrolase [Sphingobacterium sp. DK4209]QGA25972.1 MBL fold metallo-hydrolase [Sphingobacterium sp. dk4302]
MRVTFLGTGTSQGVPVIACHCPVCQSSDKKDNRLRSSILLEYNGHTVVVDTGPDFRYQMLRQRVDRLDAVLMTHSHKDHVAGLDDVRAYNYQQQQSIPIYANKATHDALRKEFYYAFSEHRYPGVPQLELEEIHAAEAFELYGELILPIEVMHFKMPVLGFRIGDFAYITDAKTISDLSFELLAGVKVLVLNALQKEPHISHLTLEEALEVAKRIAPEKTYLTHISHRFGKHEDIQKELPDGVYVAFDNMVIELD